MAESLNSTEMPKRRGHSYISEFPALDDSVSGSIDRPLHKTRSTDLPSKLLVDVQEEDLLNLHHPVRLTKSQEANLHSAVSIPRKDSLDLQHEKQLEEFREQLDLLPFKKKYSSITVPVSVRYSTMAGRPRSPKSKNALTEQQLDRDKMLSGLDETLLRIRQQLNMLSVERVTMEHQMEELTKGINHARLQCHNQCRQGNHNASSIRRARSSANPRMSQRKLSQSNSASPRNMLSPQEAEKPALTSPTLSSPGTGRDSPDFVKERQRSVSVSDSTYPFSLSNSYTSYGSLGRSVSKSNSSRIRGLSLTSPNVSLSQGSESIGSSWLSTCPIPELPESPRLSKPSSPLLSAKNNSTPALNYASNTAPRPYSARRTYSSSSQPSSNPDVSKQTKPKIRDYQPFHSPLLNHRNSLPESVMNKILENEIDVGSTCDSLSQASLSQASLSQLSTDEGSPKSQGSTLILRRSSLTGQVEHIHRPRYRVKTNSFHGSLRKSGSKSSSHNSLNITGHEYRVLNTGFRHNRRNRVILPNSVETTV